MELFYSPGAAEYTDYPLMTEQAVDEPTVSEVLCLCVSGGRRSSPTPPTGGHLSDHVAPKPQKVIQECTPGALHCIRVR